MRIAVASGKGSTGKTSVVAGMAALARDFVMADCDVDAANLHLVLTPQKKQTEPFIAGHIAHIREEDCTGCGECHSLCQFSSIDRIDDDIKGPTFRVDPVACEGCGVCVHFCPVSAIDFPDSQCGEWSLSQTRFGTLVHAELGVGAIDCRRLASGRTAGCRPGGKWE